MNPLYNGFVYVVWFISTYYVVALLLSLYWQRSELYDSRPLTRTPKVSVLVPAYNEEDGIADTILSLKALTYPNFEVFVLDDGSTDSTERVAREAIGDDERFTFSKNPHNMGKARTLNRGIELSSGEFITTMDADSMVEPDVLTKAIPYFESDNVGAVTVSVRVANTRTLLNKIFDLEFRIGLSLLLKTLSFHNVVFVTPGPFSLYRRSAIEHIGGFDPTNLTEDLEIAYRLNKAGYKIENALEAIVRTNLPETWRETYIQRRRWYTGAIQTIVRHRSMWLRKKHGLFGFLIPFNHLIIAFGIMLVMASLWLTGTNMIEGLLSLQYTGFNILERLSMFTIDPLRVGTVTLTGVLGFAATITMLGFGLRYVRTDNAKLPGIIGYPALFFLYQIFWIGAIASYISRRTVSWR